MRYKTEIDNVSKFCVAPFMSLNVDSDSELWNDIRNYVTDNYVTLGDYLKINSMRGE